MTDQEKANISASTGSTTHEIYAEVRAMYNEMAKEVLYFADRMPDSNEAMLAEHPLPSGDGLTPPERRMFIRSLCALFETIANLLKVVVLHTTSPELIGEAERAVLTERSYSLKDNGVAAESKAKLQTIPNIKFAFNIFARSKETGFVLDTSAKEWQALERTFRIRDRLTHPHALGDLTVSNEDLQGAGLALTWFHLQFLEVTTMAAEALKARSRQQ
jgi:hypothetical protein